MSATRPPSPSPWPGPVAAATRVVAGRPAAESPPGAAVRAGLAVASGAVGLVLVGLRAAQGATSGPVWVEPAAQLAGAAALLLRREVQALAVCLVLSLLSPVVAASVALYLVGRWTASSVLSGGCLGVALVAVAPVTATTAYRSGVSVPLALVLGVSVPWLVGRAQRATARAARAEAARAEAARRADADATRVLARVRLAAELHDIVASRLSLVVLHANLLETTTADPAARVAAAEIREVARAALGEMREVLRVIRDPAGGTLDRHSLAEVDAYVAQAREVGQPVTALVTAVGREPPDRAERTAVMVVREGLTNAVRHAPGATTRVLVEESPAGRVRAQVVNGPPGAGPTGLTTGGTGLAGLRERVTLLGGRLAAGPTPDGGFLLEAEVPRSAP